MVVGSGNAAWVLAQAWAERGHSCHGVLARDEKKGKELAAQLHVQFHPLWPEPTPFEGVVLLAVSDQALPDTALEARRRFPKALLMHVSGATSLSVLPGRAAVVWPLASLQRGGRLNHSKTQVYWEVSQPEDRSPVAAWAQSLSHRTTEMSSESRLALHTAAALSNNFVTHLLVESRKLCEKHGVDPHALHELWEYTVHQQINHPQGDWQTGPARRRDENTLRAHEELLRSQPALAAAYRALSESIQATHPDTSSDPRVNAAVYQQEPRSL